MWLQEKEEEKKKERECRGVCFSWVTDRLLSPSQRWLTGPNISHCLLMKSWIKPSAWSLTHTWARTHTQYRKHKHRRPLHRTPCSPSWGLSQKNTPFVGLWSNYFSEHSCFFSFRYLQNWICVCLHARACVCVCCSAIFVVLHVMSVQHPAAADCRKHIWSELSLMTLESKLFILPKLLLRAPAYICGCLCVSACVYGCV